MYAIKTEKLTKKYKEKTAVSNLDLKINEGEMYGLLGVNGAGKTTTMKMLTTLIMPTSGEAELLGHSIKTDRAAVKQIIGISPQESAAAMNLTARENLELMAEVYGFSKKVAKAKASELIERFSMREFENRKAKKLSGGEVRRLSIAMALISEPKILFLDEPTLGLDVIARHSLWVEIEKLKGKITVILTTHYLEEAVALCDRIGDKLTPGITVFGMSFISLFSSMLIAKDRTTSFMMRLFTSPLKAHEFIIGYTLPLLPMAILQSAVCVVVAFFLGLEVSVNILLMLAVNIPISIVFISLGLLLGTLLNEKAVGGICGALLTNLSAWFSNIWFDTAMVGGWFKNLANALPFAHAVNAARDAISGNYSDIMPELIPVCGYAVVLLVLAVVVFSVMMKRNK